MTKLDTWLHDDSVEIIPSGVRVSTIERPDNPTDRSREAMIVIGPANFNHSDGTAEKKWAAVSGVMASPELQQYANQIMRSCTGIAAVSFGVAQSDYIVEFALDARGTVFQRSCLEPGVAVYPTWKEQICL
jgi:hypothetical protein